MATIIPLRGLRYDEKKAGKINNLVTPPYDVIDASAQEAYYELNPHNVIRLEYGKKFPTDDSDNNRYTRAYNYFQQWQSEGILQQETEPALYLYQQKFNVGDQTLVRTGIICGVKLEPYETGIVLPHEETMPKHKADRLALMKSCAANFSPIFGLFSDSERKIDNLLVQSIYNTSPAIDFVDELGHGHKLWVIEDAAIINQVQELIKEQRILIADGHHRYETALNYSRENPAANHVMMTLVNLYDPGLIILPTHRLVIDSSIDGTQLLDALQKDFSIERISESDVNKIIEKIVETAGFKGKGDTTHRQVFGLYMGENVFNILTLKNKEALINKMPSDRSEAWCKLDVSVLQRLILEKLMGIDQKALAGGEVIKYTRDEKEAVKAVDDGWCKMAFLMNPTLIAEVTEVAAKGEKMPQKSTFFYPKLITGLVINKF